MHLGTIFTEVRLKQVLEFRSLDTCNFGCICNGPSFFTGLIYGSLDETFETKHLISGPSVVVLKRSQNCWILLSLRPLDW